MHSGERNKECNVSVTYLKYDVKINGAPVEKGTIKIGAGDVFCTGEKIKNRTFYREFNQSGRIEIKVIVY